jgi:hypothetical protein
MRSFFMAGQHTAAPTALQHGRRDLCPEEPPEATLRNRQAEQHPTRSKGGQGEGSGRERATNGSADQCRTWR